MQRHCKMNLNLKLLHGHTTQSLNKNIDLTKSYNQAFQEQILDVNLSQLSARQIKAELITIEYSDSTPSEDYSSLDQLLFCQQIYIQKLKLRALVDHIVQISTKADQLIYQISKYNLKMVYLNKKLHKHRI